jgi:hypothetical protein
MYCTCGCCENWSGSIGSADRKMPREVTGFKRERERERERDRTGLWSRDPDVSEGRSAFIFKGMKS